MNTARLRRALFILRAIAGVSWLAALVLAAGGARAQEGESERQPEAGTELESPAGARAPDERRVAVLILAAGGVDADSADALTELAIGSVASRGGIRIVGKEELQAQLGQGEARSIECVSSAACLGRLGVELDVDEVIAGTVGRRGDRWIFNINRIDIRTGELVGRAFRETGGDIGELASAIQSAIPTLYETVEQPATLLVAATVAGAEVYLDGSVVGVYRLDQPVRLEALVPGRHVVRVTAPGHVDWTRTVDLAAGTTLQLDASLDEIPEPGEAYVSPLLWIGAGVAILGGGAAVWMGLRSRRPYDAEGTRADAVEFVDDRERDALFANIGMAVAGAGLLTAVIGALLSDFDGEEDVQDSPQASPVHPGGVRAGGAGGPRTTHREAPERAEAPRLGVTPLAGGGMLNVEGRY